MGRTRTKARKAALLASAAADASEAKPQPPIEALLEKAGELLVQCDYELAGKFIDRVLQRSPHHADAREMLGVVQLETGDLDAARQTFSSLLPPNPHAPPTPPPAAHLYLAQLSDDDPLAALEHYRAAVDILTAQLKGKQSAQDASAALGGEEAETRHTIVRALIGQVEVWMDPSHDLCFDPAAEQTCESLLAHALEVDPDNGEALQALASVRMSQQRPDDARVLLEKAWAAWKDLEADDPRLPPIPSRIALVKLLVELELYPSALDILRGILAADDEEVEAWYLEGWTHFLRAEQAHDAGAADWAEHARDARDALESCLALHTAQEHPDAPLREHARELVAKLGAMGIKASPDDDGQDGEGWEDVEGSDSDDDVDMS